MILSVIDNLISDFKCFGWFKKWV